MSIRQHLIQLESSGLIGLAQTIPELEYFFRHAMVQDASYQSLLHEDRKQLHRIVGETLERLHPDRIDELAPLLGWHFAETGDSERAFHYYVRAADHAAAIHAYYEAEAHYRAAIKLSPEVSVTGEQLAKLYAGQGRMLEHAGRFEEAVVVYQELEKLAQEREDQYMICLAVAHLSSCYVLPTPVHNLELADRFIQRGLGLARTIDHPELEADLLWSQMVRETHYGDIERAVKVGERCAEIAKRHKLGRLLARTLNWLALNLQLNGVIDRGQAYAEEAHDLFLGSNNFPMLVDNLNQQGLIDILHLDFESAQNHVDEANELSLRIDNLWNLAYAAWLKGMIFSAKGEWGKAQDYWHESMEQGKEAGFIMSLTTVPMQLGILLRQIGLAANAEKLHRQAQSNAEEVAPFMLRGIEAELAIDVLVAGRPEEVQQWRDQSKQRHFSGEIGTALALSSQAHAAVVVAAHSGNWLEAMEEVEAALKEARRRRLAYHESLLMLDYGRCLSELGRPDEAEENCRSTLEFAKTNALIPLQWQLHSALESLYRNQDKHESSDLHRYKAAQLAGQLASSLRNPEQKKAFMNTPEVRKVLPG